MGLFDDVVQGLGKEITNIKTRSQKMLDCYNLGQEIAELKQQKINQLASIGKLIYDNYQQQINIGEESITQTCKAIAVLEQDIAHLQKQLDDLKQAKTSPTNK